MYGYVLGDPVNFIDPTGELWKKLAFWLVLQGLKYYLGDDPVKMPDPQEPQKREQNSPSKKKPKKKSSYCE